MALTLIGGGDGKGRACFSEYLTLMTAKTSIMLMFMSVEGMEPALHSTTLNCDSLLDLRPSLDS